MNIFRCDLCPRNCRINRKKGIGFCKADDKIKISWFGHHFGEEPPISGPSRLRRSRGGSGTIFFSNCNLKCVFCQNWQISQPSFALRFGGLRKGKELNQDKSYDVNGIVEMMLKLQEEGSLNINLVSPTVWSYWLEKVIITAKRKGVKIPIVWNTNGYEKTKTLKEFEGLVDIYLPDYKYDNEKLAIKYSSAPGYPEVARKAILEMQRQVGDLQIDQKGKAIRGLIVRHLILPGQIENTKNCLRFVKTISDRVHLSLMTQYNPLYRAREFAEINRPIGKQEFEAANKLVEGLGIKYGWVQEFGGAVKCFSPDFEKENPFG